VCVDMFFDVCFDVSFDVRFDVCFEIMFVCTWWNIVCENKCALEDILRCVLRYVL
jgi:hypothetical protein